MFQALSPGKYDFYVSSVIKTNKQGERLTTKNGKIFQKVKLTIISNGETFNVYDALFNKERIEQLVNSIGKHELKDAFKSGTLFLDDLIGESGACVVSIRPAKGEYPPQPVVSVYVKRDSSQSIENPTKMKERYDDFPAARAQASDSFDSLGPLPVSAQEAGYNGDEDADIPF